MSYIVFINDINCAVEVTGALNEFRLGDLIISSDDVISYQKNGNEHAFSSAADIKLTGSYKNINISNSSLTVSKGSRVDFTLSSNIDLLADVVVCSTNMHSISIGGALQVKNSTFTVNSELRVSGSLLVVDSKATVDNNGKEFDSFVYVLSGSELNFSGSVYNSAYIHLVNSTCTITGTVKGRMHCDSGTKFTINVSGTFDENSILHSNVSNGVASVSVSGIVKGTYIAINNGSLDVSGSLSFCKVFIGTGTITVTGDVVNSYLVAGMTDGYTGTINATGAIKNVGIFSGYYGGSGSITVHNASGRKIFDQFTKSYINAHNIIQLEGTSELGSVILDGELGLEGTVTMDNESTIKFKSTNPEQQLGGIVLSGELKMSNGSRFEFIAPTDNTLSFVKYDSILLDGSAIAVYSNIDSDESTKFQLSNSMIKANELVMSGTTTIMNSVIDCSETSLSFASVNTLVSDTKKTTVSATQPITISDFNMQPDDKLIIKGKITSKVLEASNNKPLKDTITIQQFKYTECSRDMQK